MSCSPFDLRDYFFEELPEEGRRQTDLYLKSCASCREELGVLRSTQAILMTSPDEEIPQRIGFVSDRVYEPSRTMRWWRAFWASGPRLGFASAAMLSMALIVSAMHRPVVAPSAPAVDVAGLRADFARQVNVAVEKAVAESDARQEERTVKLVAATTRRFEAQIAADKEAVSQSFAIMEKYARRDIRAALFEGGSR